MKKLTLILINFLPILIMIGLIPVFRNDYLLSIIYVLIVAVSLFVKHEKTDLLIFFVGLFAMIISESIFVSTGVETFNRRSLFNLIPLWLPILWGYAFIAIKRGVLILN